MVIGPRVGGSAGTGLLLFFVLFCFVDVVVGRAVLQVCSLDHRRHIRRQRGRDDHRQHQGYAETTAKGNCALGSDRRWQSGRRVAAERPRNLEGVGAGQPAATRPRPRNCEEGRHEGSETAGKHREAPTDPKPPARRKRPRLPPGTKTDSRAAAFDFLALSSALLLCCRSSGAFPVLTAEEVSSQR